MFVLARFAGLALMLASIAGCGGELPARPAASHVERLGRRETTAPRRLAPAQPAFQVPAVIVHRTYEDVSTDPVAATKRVAVDLDLRPQIGKPSGLDLLGIHLFDADTRADYGAGPQMHRLTDEADAADHRDPIFADKRNYRCLLIYQVPRACQRVQLKLDGDLLTPDPLPLEAGWPDMPRETAEPLAVIKLGEVAGGQDRNLMLIACRDWSRVRTPADMALPCLTRQKIVQAQIDSHLEVNRDLAPMTVDFSTQPFYVPRRFFLVSFRCPHGAQPVDVELRAVSTSLPRPSDLQVTRDTLETLARMARQKLVESGLP